MKDSYSLIKDTGEVSAIVGYLKQYEICALEIYDALRDNQLEGVEFASKDLKKLDDVLIVCKDYVLAYQVKDLSQNFTYRSLLNIDDSLLKGSFEDYSALKSKYPDKEIRAFYISNQKVSSHDKIKTYGGTKKPSFKEFKNKFWDKLNDSSFLIESLPKDWNPIVEELKKVVGINGKELESFIKCFKFLFEDDYNKAKESERSDNQIRIQDIKKISKQIFSIVGKRGNIYLNKAQVLREFDLLSRYETHFKHSFFVDNEHYQPIKDTITDLELLLEKVKGGYIALIGNAGSGKSTLLTKWINGRKENILKYYAYVNKEMNNEFGYRGEADIFLKDLLIQIREKHLSSEVNLPSNDLMQLQKQLYKELESLSRGNEKTFIIVDGLDHIEREQSVNRSLVDILPNPEQIPQNIYFILGTRTTENLEELPERIKINLSDENRVVKIAPLSLLQVKSLLDSHQINLSGDQISNLHSKTLGHPLFLRYTVEEIISSDESEHTKIISQKEFNGDIYTEYRVFWNANKGEDEFIDLLGILSRFRYSHIDLSLLSLFSTNRKSGTKIKKVLEHYFFKQGEIWQFFHNSFKEFLKEETAKDIITDKYNEQYNKDFHVKIYEVINGIKGENDYKPNILFHLYEAKEFEKITELSSQSFFREQWFGYRNYKYIFEDIKIAARASYFVRKPKILFNCFISYAELNQRIDNLFLSNYTNTFLNLGLIGLSNSFIFDATEVHVSNGKLLEYALEVYEKGYEDLALELLKKGTPNYLLGVSKKVSPSRYDRNELTEIDEVSLIIDWVKLASLFDSIDNVIIRIEKLEIEYEEHRPKGRNRNLLVEAIYALTDLHLYLKNWEKLRQIESHVLNLKQHHQFFYYFDIVWELKNEDKLFNKSLEIIENWKESDSNRINKRLALYHAFIKKDFKKAISFFKLIKKPNEIERVQSYDRFNEDFLNYIFDYSRLYYTLTKHFENEPDFTPVEESKKHLTSYFKEFAFLGRTFAYFYTGSPDAAKGFLLRFKAIMGYFHYHVNDYRYEYSIVQNKSSLVNLILGISSKISIDFFNEMLEELEIEWTDNTRYWGNSARQKIIDFVIETNHNDIWCERQLNQLQETVFDYDDVNAKVDNGVAQIELWTKLKKYDKGKGILDKLMLLSVDIRYEKDNQLDSIMDWLMKLEGDYSKEFESYLGSLESIDYSTSHSADTLADKILQRALSKGNGFKVFKYLLLEGYINLTDALEYYLTHLIDAFNGSSLLIKLFSRIILNHDGTHRNRNGFLSKLFSSKPSLEILNQLVEEVNIYSIYEERRGYLTTISEYAEELGITSLDLGIDIKPTQKQIQSSRSELRLKELGEMQYSEVLKKTKSFQDILDLLDKEDKANSYFKWSSVILERLEKINDEEIKLIVDKIDFSVNELSDLAKGLDEKNRDTKLIIELLYKGVSNSTDYNWSWVYDGGSKQKVYNHLLTLDNAEKVRELAFKDFADSIEISSTRLLHHIDGVFRIIDPEFSYESYYPNLKEYKDLITDIHYKETEVPSIIGDFSEEESLESLLLFLLSIPSRFDSIIFEILLEEFDSNLTLIKTLLDKLFEEKNYFKFAKLLSAISVIDTNFVSDYNHELIEIINNDRYDIHHIACRITERVGIDYELFYKPKTKNLPFIYTIEIAHSPELILSESERMDRLKKTGYLRDTNDPIEYCHLYIKDIEKVSKESGIKAINLATRIKDIGKDYYILPDWLKGLSEEEIRKIYEHKLELKIAYNRPQYQKVWCGFMVVLKELFELGLINQDLCDFISSEFDEHTFFVKPIKKPKFIPSIVGNKERDYVPSADKKWVYGLTDKYLDETLSFVGDNNLFILAEISVIDGQGDGIANETRQAFVDLDELIDIEKDQTIFNLTIRANIKDYQFLNGGNSICFYNWILQIGKKRNWLAINPSLAKAMNLQLSDQGNFRWLDEKENIVVESHFWRNNDNQNRNRNLHSDSGHGWYVTMSREGINRIKNLGVKRLYHHKKIFRRMEFIQRRHNNYINESNDHWNITQIDI